MMMVVVIMAAVTIIECSRARHRLRALHARSQSCPQPFEVKAKVPGLHLALPLLSGCVTGANDAASLCLSFLISETGRKTVPTSQKGWSLS